MGICCVAQEAQQGLCKTGWGGRGRETGGGSEGGDRCMPTADSC